MKLEDIIIMIEFRRLFAGILFLIGMGCLFSACSNKNNFKTDYRIDHYIDTIDNHVILSTVVNTAFQDNVIISTIELDNLNKLLN